MRPPDVLTWHLLCASTPPPPPPAWPPPFSTGLTAQGASKDVCPTEGIPVLSSPRFGYATRCFPKACPSEADPVVEVQAERSWAAFRRTPAHSGLGRVFCCGARGHGSSRSRFRRPCAELPGGRVKGRLLRCPPTRGPQAFLRPPNQHAGATLSLFRREACRQRQLGVRLLSWREGPRSLSCCASSDL